MYNIKQIFANNIKRLRKNRNLTQEQFAELIGMQWKSVVNFESGRNLANSQNMEKICAKLKIAPAELFLTEEKSSFEVLNKLNIILSKMNRKKLNEAYRVIAVLFDESHFCE